MQKYQRDDTSSGQRPGIYGQKGSQGIGLCTGKKGQNWLQAQPFTSHRFGLSLTRGNQRLALIFRTFTANQGASYTPLLPFLHFLLLEYPIFSIVHIRHYKHSRRIDLELALWNFDSKNLDLSSRLLAKCKPYGMIWYTHHTFHSPSRSN